MVRVTSESWTIGRLSPGSAAAEAGDVGGMRDEISLLMSDQRQLYTKQQADRDG